MTDALEWLQRWYAAQCNGNWEQEHGVSITTLDNPGWMVAVDLEGTELESHARDGEVQVVGEPPGPENGNIGGPDWMECRISALRFVGAGDPRKLRDIIEQFRLWAPERGASA